MHGQLAAVLVVDRNSVHPAAPIKPQRFAADEIYEVLGAVPGTMSIVFFALEWPDEARLPQTGAWSYWRFTAELIEKLERPD